MNLNCIGVDEHLLNNWTEELSGDQMAFFSNQEDQQQASLIFQDGGLLLKNALDDTDVLYPFDRSCPLGKYSIPRGAEFPVWAPNIEHVLGRTWQDVIDSGSAIYLVEGYKKCMAAIAVLKIPAICLPGVWFRRSDKHERVVPNGLLPFLNTPRTITMCFDTDHKLTTKAQTERGLFSCANALQFGNSGLDVRIARLPQLITLSKTGLDDYIEHVGADAVKAVLDEAKPYYQAHLEQITSDGESHYPDQFKVTDQWFGNAPLPLPETGIIGIRLPKGFGKTSGTLHKLRGLVDPLLMICPLQRLRLSAKRQARKMGITLHEFSHNHPDLKGLRMDDIKQGKHRDKSFVLCPESVHWLSRPMVTGSTIIIDEARQLAVGLLESDTFSTRKRAETFDNLRDILPYAKRLILLDADLDDATIEFWSEFCHLPFVDKPISVVGTDNKSTGFDFEMLLSPLEYNIEKAVRLVQGGWRVLLMTDSLENTKVAHSVFKDHYRGDLNKCLVLNSETAKDPAAKQFFDNPDREVRRYNFVIASPTVRTGVSIEELNCFDMIFVLCSGAVYTDRDISQAAWRVRDTSIPRFIYVPLAWAPFMSHKLCSAKTPKGVKGHLEMSLERSTEQYSYLGFLPTVDRLPTQVCAEYHSTELDFHSKHVAGYNVSKGALRKYTRARFLNEGCTEVTILNTFLDDPQVIEIPWIDSKVLRALKPAIKAERYERIASAEIIRDYKPLLNKDDLSQDEQDQLLASLASDYFGLKEIDGQIVQIWSEHRHNLNSIIAMNISEEGYATFARSVIKSQTDGMYILSGDVDQTVRRGRLLKSLGIPELLSRFSALEQQNLPCIVTDVEAHSVYTRLRSKPFLRDMVKSLLSVNPPKDEPAAIGFVSKLLKSLGFTTKSVKSNGSRFTVVSDVACLLHHANLHYQKRLGYVLEVTGFQPDSEGQFLSNKGEEEERDKRLGDLTSSGKMSLGQNPVSGSDVTEFRVKIKPAHVGAFYHSFEPEIVDQADRKVWIKFPDLAPQYQLEFYTWLTDDSRIDGFVVRLKDQPTKTFKLTGLFSKNQIECRQNCRNSKAVILNISDLEIGMKRISLSTLKQMLNEEIMSDF